MSYQINIPLTFTYEQWKDFAAGVLTTAAEGGIGYWADYRTQRRDSDSFVTLIHDITTVEDDDGLIFQHRMVNHDVLLWACRAILTDSKVNNAIRDQVIRALSYDLDAGEIDAEGADCLIQIGVFGEIVFG